MQQSDVDWCRRHFARMRDGATWVVPRSGLIFQRWRDVLWLTTRMPYGPELAEAARQGADVPADADALLQWQRQDLACISARFGAAGISVVDKTHLPDGEK